MKNKAAVVILNLNGKKYLSQFLPALVRHTSLPDVELVVADNGSTDGSTEFVKQEYPQIRRIELDRNYGFTGGYNRALRQIDADYYVLLNSDVEVTENWLQPLLAFLDSHPDTAVCAPKILSFANRGYFEYAGAAGGFIDKYGYPFCRGRILKHIEEDRGQYNDTCEVFWTSGACMAVRADVYRNVGGLDDSFFAHMEEIDFCWRARQMGYSVVCCPQAAVYHVGGGTLPQETPMKLFLNYRNSLLMLYKNLPAKNCTAILTVRLIADGAAAAVYALHGKFAAFAAVLKAHISFWRSRKKLQRSQQPPHAVPCIYPRSILIQFYLRRKRKFSDLNDSCGARA